MIYHDRKIEKYGFCNTIFIRKILEEDSAILFQNAFPTLEKYIDHVHTSNGAPAKVGSLLKNEILNNFKYLLKLINNWLVNFYENMIIKLLKMG